MSGGARLGRTAGAALAAALGAAALAGAVALLLRPFAWTPAGLAAGLALAALAWIRPVASVAALLAVAPILGNRPTTGPYLALITLTACTVPGWLARLAGRDRARTLEVLATPVGLALVGYGAVSVLSLSSLPVYAPAEMVGAATLGEALGKLPATLAGAEIVDTVYPVLTVVLTLHALAAALTIAVALRDDAGRPAGGVDAATLVTTALLAGLAMTLAAAVLDAWALIDLRRLRAFDPYTNPSGAARLQSTFGHAGWLAQYLCFTTPAVLACWLWPPAGAASSPRARLGRGVAAAVVLAATLVAVVLSYQRGGWITWATVGAAVAAVAVRLASSGDGPTTALAPSARRLVVSAGVALVLALGAGLLVVRVAGGAAAMERFAARARTITQVSDRQHHVLAGLRLGAQLPVLGGGSESFAMRYREEYLLAGGAFYARGHSPVLDLYGSAHNVFAQTFAGKGVAGLAALVLALVTAAAALLRRLRDPAATQRDGIVAAIAAGMLAAFAVYGQVQEVFYIPTLQLTVFAAFGLAAGLAVTTPSGADTALRRLGWLAAALAAILAVHLVHAYVVPGRLAEGFRDRAITQAGDRLSAPVLGEDGVYYQTSGAHAAITVPRQATVLSFELRRLAPGPQVVDVRFDDRLVDRVRLETSEWRRVQYPLGKLRDLPRRLHIAVEPAWRPAGQPRDVGVAVRRLRWSPD